MSMVASFEIGYTRYLAPPGEPPSPTSPPPPFASDPDALLPLYQAMVLTRQFDLKAIALQRTGKIGTFASALGQEAIGVAWPLRCGPKTCWCPRTATTRRSLCGASR